MDESITSYCQQVCGGGECGTEVLCPLGIDRRTQMPATVVQVAADSAYEMEGPYLACYVTCPFCGGKNVFYHLESYARPVKAIEVCEHIRTTMLDDDGNRQFEFAGPVSADAVANED